MELNNGRTLTLFDLGRIPMARRMGLDKVLAQNGLVGAKPLGLDGGNGSNAGEGGDETLNHQPDHASGG